MDEGKLWSFVRSVIALGANIRQDYDTGQIGGYELYSATLDAKAAERSHEFAVAWFDELARLRAENERLKADAARYEWLRRQHWSDASMCVVMKPRSAVRLGHDCPAVDRLDAAIDAAMAQGDKA